MNPTVQNLLPPALVLSAAAYFGWPDGGPLIQDEELVRATSVRWTADDLKSPEPPVITADPFASVLVVSETQEVEEETGKLIPATKPLGPPASELTGGFRLTGIAQMGSARWAILNGRPAKVGEIVETQNSYQHPCEIVAVKADHVIARCQETVVKIEVRKYASAVASDTPAATEGQPESPSQTNTTDGLTPESQPKSQPESTSGERTAVETLSAAPPNQFIANQ